MKKENRETIEKTFIDGHREAKVIYGLEEGEEKYYKLLGEGCGISLIHCCIMGEKYKENFWERVFAYKISLDREQADMIENVIGNSYISVEFYELG